MVEDAIGPVIIGVGPTDYTNDRQVLAAGTGNSVQDAEPAHSESDNTGAHAPGARVAVGGVPGVELVAAADEVEPRLGDQVVQEGQVEVAGDGEDVVDTDLDKPPSQVAAERAVASGGNDRPRDRAGPRR